MERYDQIVKRTGATVWYLAWAAVVALLLFSYLVIGVFVLPAALVAVVLVARRGPVWPEALGGLEGAAAMCFLIAYLNRDYNPCPPGPIILGPGQASFSCGGADSRPWLIAGVVLAVIGVAAYLIASRNVRAPATMAGRNVS